MRMDSEYSLSPLDRERYRIWSERCSAFGIEVYHGSNRLAMTPILPLAHPRTRELHVSWVRFLASIGMGFSLHLDDNRFPLHPFDLDTAGAGANLDARYITDVYREAKKVSPDFIMQFCPPFYWGPDGPANYPEKREPYLKSLGEFLDPEIDVYWTGPRVKSYSMSTNKVAWYANLIGRKPGVFHNGNCLGTHNHLCFGADPTGFKKSHPKDLFDHISFFQQNMRFAYPVAHSRHNGIACLFLSVSKAEINGTGADFVVSHIIGKARKPHGRRRSRDAVKNVRLIRRP